MYCGSKMRLFKYVVVLLGFLIHNGNLFSNVLLGGEDRITGFRKEPFTIAPFIGINYNMYPKIFQTHDEKYICYDFANGKGLEFKYGIKAFYWISRDWAFSPAISLNELGGEFSKTVNDIPFNNENNKVEYLELEEKVKLEYKSITLDLLLCYNIIDFDMYMIFGPSICYNRKITFQYSEKILSPKNAYYLNGEKSKILQAIDYPDYKKINLLLKSGFGLSYRIDKRIYINPELLYAFPLNTPAESIQISSIQFTCGLKLNLF
jgi:hypothetical protein